MGVVVVDLNANESVTPTINKIIAAQKRLDKVYQQTVKAQSKAFMNAGKVQQVFSAKVANTEAAIRKQIAALRLVQQNVTLGGTAYQKAGQQIQLYQNKLNAVNAAGVKKTGVFQKMQTSVVGLGNAFVALGAGLAARGFIDAGVQAERTQRALKFLGDQYGETAQLNDAASRAAGRFALGQTEARKQVTALFGRLRPMGKSMEDIESVFNGVNVAAAQMSLSSSDVSGVMLQLSQALGRGTLQGDEFVSIMERLPKIGSAVADVMGINVEQLKEFSSQGKLTAAEIIKAMKKLEKEGFPEPDAIKKFTAATQDFADIIGKNLLKVLTPLINVLTGALEIFNGLPEPLQAAVVAFGGITAAAALLAPAIPIIVAGFTALVAVVTGPVGIVAGLVAAGAALFSFMKSSEDSKKPIDEVNKKTNETRDAVQAAARAKQEFVDKTKEHIAELQKEKNVIKQQEQAYDNAMRVTDARLNAEGEINKLNIMQLENAYEHAQTAGQRLRIAKQILQAEISGAKISYQQTLNNIKAEQQRLQFRREAAVIEAKMIEAKGKLAAAQAKDAEKAALITQRTQEAVSVQRENIRLLDGQIRAQNQIAGYQKTAAQAVLDQQIHTAKVNFEQKLVSDEIGMSTENARNLSGATVNVANNARSASFMFISVANNAASAAVQINKAAAAQERLNRARRKKSKGGGGGGGTTQQAEGGYNRGSFKAFARGGVVKGPTLGLIGEGGEPEYIIPQSKAAGFAANFMAGKRGAGAIPGFAEGGMAVPSTANVSIQTGPVTQMDGANYVTTQEMSRAVEAGVTQTLDILRRDSSTRAALGLG